MAGEIVDVMYCNSANRERWVDNGLIRALDDLPGMDELKWLLPVRPGDSLRTEVEVLELRPSATKPDRGIARLRYRGYNQRGEEVIRFTVNHLLRREGG